MKNHPFENIKPYPVIARFFSPDNFVQAPGSTQGYNRYSYCLNNPLQWVDPSGEVSLTPWYLDLVGFVHWIDHMDEMPSYGTYLGEQGCFVCNDEMKYYHADGRITQLDIPEVQIDGTITSIPFPNNNKYTDSQYDYSEKNNNNVLNSQVVDITLNAVGVVSSVVSEEGKGVLKYTVEGVGWITYGTQNARVAKNIYENKRLTIEDSYDLVTTNVGFWGGPCGAMIALTLDMYKRAAIWISNYYSELEMELRRMNTPEIFY